ncbi:putative membrane protein [[Clostridium] sordellii ATCC 9714]|nr:putative membrane protein [[Clostridium] sordellii ATCC 9714] [Paeniclostridium sordellii ATCC 9714]
MGKNKVEHFIFILMICTSMVFIMSCYNIALMEGLSFNVLKHAVLGFIPAFLFALVGDIFIVGQIVKK